MSRRIKQHNKNHPLNLKAGDLVEVRKEDEILSTLDKRGRLDNLPFMPEMLQYCGKRFLVYKRADKTCDTISEKFVSRRMYNTVHLLNLRCDGEAHGECDATCLFFWKELWLKKIKDGSTSYEEIDTSQHTDYRCTIEDLYNATIGMKTDLSYIGDIYSCQATELLSATYPLPWWDVRQYWQEIKTGNLYVKDIIPLICIGMFNWIIGRRGIGRVFYYLTGSRRYPFIKTKNMLKIKTPIEKLDLQPGEIVQVKNIEEIVTTLKNWKNRGLAFDSHGEMLEYCGKKMKVLKQVKKIIEEKSGKMLYFEIPSVILEGAICRGHYSPDRLLCPRSIYTFWREAWLKRVDPASKLTVHTECNDSKGN